MNIDDLVAQWESQWNDWKRSIEADNTAWTREQRNAFTTWITQQETYFTNWKDEYTEELTRFKDTSEAEFNTWFDHMKGQLSTDAAGHLQTQIDTIVQNEIPAIKGRLDILENDNDKTIINTKYIGQNLYLFPNSFPFADEDLGKYFEIGGLVVNSVVDKRFNSAIVRVYKTTENKKYIAAVVSNNAQQDGYSHYAAYMTSSGATGIESILVEKKTDKVNEINNSNYDSTDKYLSVKGASRLSIEGYDTDLGSKERINPTSIIPYADRYVLESNTRQRNLARMSGKEIALYLNKAIFDTAYNMASGVIKDCDGRHTREEQESLGYIFRATNFYSPSGSSNIKAYHWGRPLEIEVDATNYVSCHSNTLTTDSQTSWEVEFPKPVIAKRNPSNNYLITFWASGLPSTNKVTITLENGSTIQWANVSSASGTTTKRNLIYSNDNILKIKKIKIELTGRYSSSINRFELRSLYIYGYKREFNTSLPLYLKANNIEKKINLLNIPDLYNQCVNMFLDRNEWWPINSMMSIKQGTASDGDVLPITSGYSNHKFILTPRAQYVDMTVPVKNEYHSVEASTMIYCYIDDSRKVHMYSTGSSTSSSNKVDYIEIAY